MSEFKCYFCSCEQYTIVALAHEIRFNCYDTDRKIYKCNHCKLVQMQPQWSEKELDEIYKGYQEKKDFKEQKISKRAPSKYLSKYLTKEDLILEIGSGDGVDLNYLTKMGYTVTGIDKNADVCDNITVIHGNYEKAFEEGNYDKVYGIQLFEHIDKPIEFLSTVIKNLTKGGKLVLEFPNIEDPLLSLYKIKEFREYYFRPDHLFFYSPKTAGLICRQANIKSTFHQLRKIKRKQRYGIINHLNWLIRRKPMNGNPHIPILDDIYKFILTKILRMSDTILLVIERN